MLAIDLVTEVCCVCGRIFWRKDRVTSGHFRATDCYGTYIGIGASWHEDCSDRARAILLQEPDADQGCFGPWQEWMGVTLDHAYHAQESVSPKRRPLQ